MELMPHASVMNKETIKPLRIIINQKQVKNVYLNIQQNYFRKCYFASYHHEFEHLHEIEFYCELYAIGMSLLLMLL